MKKNILLNNIVLIVILFNYFTSTALGIILNKNISLYHVSPMKYEILDGTKLPEKRKILKRLKIQACRDEFEPLSFLIDPLFSHEVT